MRIEKGVRLLDLAKDIGKSVSFVSAVEVGDKPIPSGFVDLVAGALDLRRKEWLELQRAADRTRREIPVDRISEDDREDLSALARRLETKPLTAKERERLRRLF